MRRISITPCTGPGAEIGNVDLSTELGDEDFALIRQAFADHGLIFFRDQRITPEQHIAFAKRWGAININRFFTPVEGYPEIAEVRKEPDQTTNIGGGWHTDHSYDAEPAMGSILVARELPPKGGDTLFADMAAAYDALDDETKAMLEGLEAVHSSKHIFGGAAAYRSQSDAGERLHNPDAADALDDVVHPVVITHPLSGRKILYVNAAFTVGIKGWSQKDSMKLLMPLYAHAAQDRFVTRFAWKPGSIAFWDNRATWHYALNDYQGERRVMHRITLEGCALH
ncbi:MAG: TauD/TfdA dioxygenase family protein [Parasphingopyxis sp.]|uniref:TauD/TfdA dioxygenase family protein n=1 Tax=Parasphingopyxis sp. TaxID=1920299 RepID=UPI003FA03E3A